MLSQFSSPFHSWDTPFDSPSRQNIIASYSDNQAPITKSRADDLKDVSKNYFSVSTYKPSELRTGYPHNIGSRQNANVDKDFLELKLSLATRSFAEPNMPQTNYLHYYLRLIASYLRFKNYPAAVQAASAAMSKINDCGLIPFLGFIAAICCSSDMDEMVFFEAAEKSFYSSDDLPQYFRLIDEMTALRAQPDIKTPLLSLILSDTSDLAKALKERVRIFPRIGCDIHKLISRYDIRKKNLQSTQKLSEMYIERDATREALPQLVPLCEGFATNDDSPPTPAKKTSKLRSKAKQKQNQKMQSGNPTDKVLAMIQKKEWVAAIQAATEVISQNPKDGDMLQHRAYALMRFGKNHDAINDISKAIEIKKTDDRLKMRAAMWLALGERDLCNIDLMSLEKRLPEGSYDGKIEIA